MLECPSCWQELPRGAHFCAHCGTRLSPVTDAASLPGEASVEEPVINPSAQSALEESSAQETLMRKLPAGFFRRVHQEGHSPQEEDRDLTPEKEQASALLYPVDKALDASGTSYANIKLMLAEQSTPMITAMDSLLPFVYAEHRAENRALFASALARELPLEDVVWGRVAFVLGAYGNYLYRYPLTEEQRRQIWCALLWAVYYERCYRRKYLAQRCQQLLHFLQGSTSHAAFFATALNDLEALCPYLEANGLRKVQESLRQLSLPSTNLPQIVEERLESFETKTPANSRKQDTQTKPQVGKKSAALSTKDVSTQRPGKTRGEPARSPLVGNSPTSLKHGAHPSSVNTSRTSAIASPSRRLLAFFSDEQYRDFFVSLRAARLEEINQQLQSVRRSLLIALHQALLGSSLLSLQEPRRSIRLGKKNADRFAEARRLLNSTRSEEQHAGLRLFEHGARETTHPDFVQLAHEWMLYARAVVQGSPRVVDAWESKVQRNLASWEERWNLAFFYHQTGYPVEALHVLKPGLDGLSAPFTHLQLALVCALDLLLSTEPVEPVAQEFLLAHLEDWPDPLACLAWLLLAHEVQGPLHPRQQAQKLSTFQELLESPACLLDTRKDLPEARVAALEEALARKAHCGAAWFLWINDYAERHPRKYQAWIKLAETAERLGHLEVAERALQHVVEIQYHNDYAHYQEGESLPRATYLRGNLERLFEFYQRHNMSQQGSEAFQSCYPSLSHLWDGRDMANRKLIALTRSYLESYLETEQEEAGVRRELSLRELSRKATVPLEHFKAGLRVGIFVDYENIARFVPRDVEAEEVGRALVSYAAQFGEVVCQWASASPWNLSNLADVRLGLEAAHFNVRFPRRELQFSPSKKNLADFALLECLSEARVNDRLDVYLIVSGDRDYYERICSLLDAGYTVRMLAATGSEHLSARYRELEQQRVRERRASGHETADFFIDDLEEILYPLVSLN